jgi:hypothetical protein
VCAAVLQLCVTCLQQCAPRTAAECCACFVWQRALVCACVHCAACVMMMQRACSSVLLCNCSNCRLLWCVCFWFTLWPYGSMCVCVQGARPGSLLQSLQGSLCICLCLLVDPSPLLTCICVCLTCADRNVAPCMCTSLHIQCVLCLYVLVDGHSMGFWVHAYAVIGGVCVHLKVCGVCV